MTLRADLAKWLMTQRSGVVTIDDVAAALKWTRDRASAQLLALAREPDFADQLAMIGRGIYRWTPAAGLRVTPPRSPGRRLTAEEEAVGRELFGEGHSERDVAQALDCSASTAHRLYERLEAERKPREPAQPQPQLPLPETLTVTIQPNYFTFPGQNGKFRHFVVDDGRKGTLWFHEERLCPANGSKTSKHGRTCATTTRPQHWPRRPLPSEQQPRRTT